MPQHSQEICTPVSLEIGETPDLELMLDPGFSEEMDQLAARFQWEHVRSGADFDSGRAAKRAIAELGCDACKLSGVCVVKTRLEDKAETGRAHTELEQQAVMLATAPPWLSAARINRSDTDPAALHAMTATPETTKQALADGSLNAESLLAGIANEPEGLVTKQDLPELGDFNGIDPNHKIELHRLTTDNGDTFLVADASKALNFRDKPLSATEYGILTGKLLGLMLQHGSDGKPQVLSPDSTMQKALWTTAGGHLDEVRMANKNRLYATITPGSGQDPARIVIVGSHGGDAATQQAFLNRLKG